METENGVFAEEERGTLENIRKENPVTGEKQDQPQVDNGEKVIDVAIVEEKTSVDVPESKMPNTSSASNSGISKSSEVATSNKSNAKGRVPSASNTKRGLSQGLSFAAKGVQPVAMKKSIDEFLVKGEGKSTRANGPKPKGKIVNGSVSVSRLNPATRQGSSSLNAKENGGGPSSRPATIAFVPNVQRSLSGKSGSVNGAAKASSSEVSLSVNKQLKPIKTATLMEEGEDSHSTTSSNASGRRRSESGFSSRLSERAEKRKEFFTKLEQKMQAKEAEETDMQAKTVENQEAEIKQLRKSLTFKATPMPSFYKEPPAKVELKKIPTTRPKSPKLGRNKTFKTTKPNPSEGGESLISPCLNQKGGKSAKAIQANSFKDASASKKPVKKLSSKLQSHKQAPVKAGKDAVNTEEQTTAGDAKSGAEKMEENESKSETKYEIKDECACNLETQAAEVTVEG